uniref:Uncharacterized protein n=1 Tax=Paramormyrops kingsleyae TaxID=1676925 RepID=A0A3B3RQZ3_9TELE
MSQLLNIRTNGHVRTPTHIMKVLVGQDRPHQGRIIRIQRLYDSLPHQIIACIQARGGATPY